MKVIQTVSVSLGGKIPQIMQYDNVLVPLKREIVIVFYKTYTVKLMTVYQ